MMYSDSTSQKRKPTEDEIKKMIRYLESGGSGGSGNTENNERVRVRARNIILNNKGRGAGGAGIPNCYFF